MQRKALKLRKNVFLYNGMVRNREKVAEQYALEALRDFVKVDNRMTVLMKEAEGYAKCLEAVVEEEKRTKHAK